MQAHEQPPAGAGGGKGVEDVEVIIKGAPAEIAALVLAVQGRQTVEIDRYQLGSEGRAV